MIPYIAILVVIIVAALFATYKKVDLFRDLRIDSEIYSTKTVNRSTTQGTLVWNLQSKINLLKVMKVKYDKLTALGTPTPDETRILIEASPVGSLLTLDLIRTNINKQIQDMTNSLNILKNTASDKTLEDIIKNTSATPLSGKTLDDALQSFITNYAADEEKFANMIEALNTLYNRSSSSIGAAPGSASGSGGTTTTQNTGTTSTTTATSSGNVASNAGSATGILPGSTATTTGTQTTTGTTTGTQTSGGGMMVSLTDLINALAPLNRSYGGSHDEAAKDVNMNTSKPSKDSDKDVAPITTPEYQKEMEERIAKAVAKQMKDTKMIDRSTEVIDPNCPYAAYDSDATQQGVEYVQGKPSPQPDMSEYIRKDSIPCWNCTLPPQSR